MSKTFKVIFRGGEKVKIASELSLHAVSEMYKDKDVIEVSEVMPYFKNSAVVVSEEESEE